MIGTIVAIASMIGIIILYIILQIIIGLHIKKKNKKKLKPPVVTESDLFIDWADRELNRLKFEN